MANLPIPDETTWINYESQTGAGPLSFPFSVFAKADLRVKVGDTELEQSGFTFSGTLIDSGYDGGSVTLVTPAAAQDVLIWREVTPARSSDFAPASLVSVRAIDAALDRLTAHAQDARRDVVRGLTVPLGETGQTLPDAETRAGLLLAFDGEGNIDPTFTVESLTGPVETARDAAEAARDAAEASRDAAEAARDLSADYAAAGAVARTQAELAAMAAGAPLYGAVPGDLTGVPSPFLVSTSAGVAVYTHNGTVAVVVGWLGKVAFDTPALLLASTAALGPVGNILEAGGHRYQVVSTGEHLTTSGAVKLRVLPEYGGYAFSAFNPDATGATSANAVLAVADAAAVADGVPLLIAEGVFRVTANLTLASDVEVKRGGYLNFTAGQLTVNGAFKAGRYSIFTGSVSDTVGPVFGPAAVEAIYPEWFGARTTGPSGTPVDSSGAVLLALQAASRGTVGFTYRVELAQGVYHFASGVTFPAAGLTDFRGQGLGTQIRGMDGGSGHPNYLLRFTSSTTDSRIRDMYLYGGSSRQVKYGIIADVEMKHTNIENLMVSSFAYAGIVSADWSNSFNRIEFLFCGVGLWLAGGSNNNDITIDVCRFVSCEVCVVVGPGLNVRSRGCQYQASIASPYTKTFVYCYRGGAITFENDYFETQSQGGLAGMAFTVPEAVTVYAAVIFNDQPYYTDSVGTITTTLSRNASAGSRSNATFSACSFANAAYYLAGAGGSGYTAGPVTIVSRNGTGTGASGTASVSSGAISAVSSITGGTGWRIGEEVAFDQGGNITAVGRVISVGSNNAITAVVMGGSAAIYPGNCASLTLQNCLIATNVAMFALYNDTSVCEYGRIVVAGMPSRASGTTEVILLGSSITTVNHSFRNFDLRDYTRLALPAEMNGLRNYYPDRFEFTPVNSTFTRQTGRYKGLPVWRFQLNASQQVSDQITGSIVVGSSGAGDAELVGRRVYLGVRRLKSAANIKLRLTLSLTSGSDTVTAQNFDSSTSFTAPSTTGIDEVSLVVPQTGGTLNWSIELIAASAATQYVDIIGRPVLSVASVPMDAFPAWLSDRPLVGSATYDAPSLVDGATATTTVTVNGARLGDAVSVSPPGNANGMAITGYVSATNTVTIVINNESGGTVDLSNGTWRVWVTPAP